MPELRKDYILDRYVIISTERSKRPHEFKQPVKRVKKKVDYFARGNEKLTPPEIGRIEGTKKGEWKMRWFPNKFPAVKTEGNSAIRTDNEFYTYADAFGYHEIIVETPTNKQLWDLKEEDIKEVLHIYAARIKELSNKKGVKYVAVFKNHGEKGGTSIVHSHSQIIAYAIVPNYVKDKIEACKHYGGDPYGKIIENEKNSDRRCFENEHFVAFAPYASRFNFEIAVFPKRYIERMEELSDKEYSDLAEIMKKILLKLKELNAPYNYYVHYAPEGENLRLHIEVTPRLATWAGFELSTETVINSVMPEDAARFYRGEE